MAVTLNTLGEMLLKRYTQDFIKDMQMPLWAKLQRPVIVRCSKHRSNGCRRCRSTGLHPMPMSEFYADASVE